MAWATSSSTGNVSWSNWTAGRTTRRPTGSSAWAFNPTDVETLDLLQDNQARYYGPELTSLLGNLARIPSLAVPVGTGLLGDFRQVRLYVRQIAWLAIDRSGDLFQKNQCVLRVEMRAGIGVLRPQAVCVVDLTA